MTAGMGADDTRRAVIRPLDSVTGTPVLVAPLNTPVLAGLSPPMQPSILPVPRPWLPRVAPLTTPMEVRPPGVDISWPYEVDAPAPVVWEEQVEEAEASGELQ